MLLTDAALCLVSFTLAHFLRFDGIKDPVATAAFYRLLPWAALVRLPIFIYFGFYNVLIRHLLSMISSESPRGWRWPALAW